MAGVNHTLRSKGKIINLFKILHRQKGGTDRWDRAGEEGGTAA